MIRFAQVSLALLALVVLVGCGGGGGPSTVPTSGKLTIDGQAAPAGITVNLQPVDSKGTAGSGTTKEGGSFDVFSGSQGKAGAVPGKYKVVLTPPSAGAEAYSGAKGAPETKAPFADKYLKGDTTDKEVEVKSGSNTFTVDVSSK